MIKNNYVFCNNAINHEENTEYVFHNYTYKITNNFRLDIFAFENNSIGNAYCYIYDLEFYDMFEVLFTTINIGSNGSWDFRFPYSTTWLLIFEMNANPSHSDLHVNTTIYHQVRELYV